MEFIYNKIAMGIGRFRVDFVVTEIDGAPLLNMVPTNDPMIRLSVNQIGLKTGYGTGISKVNREWELDLN